MLPKAEKLLKVSIQPYIGSILEALMEPTSRGFFEVRDLFFRELVDMSKNLLNDGNKEKLGEVTMCPSWHLVTLSLLIGCLSHDFDRLKSLWCPAHGEDLHASLPSCEDAELLWEDGDSEFRGTSAALWRFQSLCVCPKSPNPNARGQSSLNREQQQTLKNFYFKQKPLVLASTLKQYKVQICTVPHFWAIFY